MIKLNLYFVDVKHDRVIVMFDSGYTFVSKQKYSSEDFSWFEILDNLEEKVNRPCFLMKETVITDNRMLSKDKNFQEILKLFGVEYIDDLPSEKENEKVMAKSRLIEAIKADPGFKQQMEILDKEFGNGGQG